MLNIELCTCVELKVGALQEFVAAYKQGVIEGLPSPAARAQMGSVTPPPAATPQEFFTPAGLPEGFMGSAPTTPERSVNVSASVRGALEEELRATEIKAIVDDYRAEIDPGTN